jgi:hypothetical protein
VEELAGFSISLLDLVNTVVEEGILPMASPATSFALVAADSATIPSTISEPRVEPGTTELKAALATADKTAWSLMLTSGSPRLLTELLSMGLSPPASSCHPKVVVKVGGYVNESIRVVNDV